VLLSLDNVYKNFGIDVILEGATIKLDRHEKTALVGRNGTGKTTLLRIITGQMEPDSGTVHLAQGARVGYLRQEESVAKGSTILASAQEAVADRLRLKQRLDELEALLEHNPSEEDLDEYASLHERLEDEGGWKVENDVVSVLKKMGFQEDEFDRPTDALSGGERTRLAIAQLLLQEPDLLILDEPTNHLDLQATEWLESWIRNYPGAVLVVSHDRVFLENTVQKVIELRNRTTKAYPGGFREFVQLRKEEDARLADVVAQQDAQIAKLDEFVRRFMNSQRTAQAKGRQKLMNRLISTRVEAPVNDKGMKAAFGDVQRSGDIVAECRRLAFGYPGLTLGKGVDWTVRIGERWGVIGENGAGKSTLVKTILGELEALGGAVRLGSKVQVGFFNQDAVDLDPEASPLEHIVDECGLEAPAARSLLGRFLLEGDDVFRPIRTLSGGEKNKLVLAELCHMSPNLLVLDEPTNHLDMASRDALIEVLAEYKGTLILISHDRQLLRAACGSILDVRKSGVVQFGGTYDEYRHKLTVPAASTIAGAQFRKPSAPPAPKLTPRELSKEIARQEKAAATLEDEVASAEQAVKDIELKLSTVSDGQEALALGREHSALLANVAQKLADWETAHERLEALKSDQAS
jgi:ATP-binding cassette, subfamily F, member 3